MMKQDKIGFTVTELLVVVLVIGILSAVVLPKFTRTLENYKTAEAEQMLSAVRDEQEARCTLGDPYTTNSSELGSWSTDASQHFNYTLQEGGMTATRTSGEYSLSIPSYLDGRICCEGCENLNKDYISCSDLMASADYRVSDECGVTPAPPPPPPPSCVKPEKPADVPCGCNNTGLRTYTWNESACKWDLGSACVGENTAPCSCVKPEKPADVPCGCENSGLRTYTWNESACKWDLGSECVGENTAPCSCVKPEKPNTSCGCNGTGTVEYTWNQESCNWVSGACINEDDSVCKSADVCKWQKGDLVTCRMSWQRYCALAGANAGFAAFVQESKGCQGTYYMGNTNGQVCTKQPTNSADVCMSYEQHIVPPKCAKSKVPSGSVNWGTARKYTAVCKPVK